MQTKNIAIRVFYGPRKVAKNRENKKINTALNNQIAQKVQSNEITITGDYNVKANKDTNECKQA